MTDAPRLIANAADLRQVLAVQASSRRRIGELVVQQGLATSAAVAAAVAAKAVAPKARLGDILVGMGCINRETAEALVAAQSGKALLDVKAYPLDPAATSALPAGAATMHRCLAVDILDGQLVVAFATEPTPDALASVRFACGRGVVGVAANNPTLLQTLVDRHYPDPTRAAVRHRALEAGAHARMADDGTSTAAVFRKLAATAIANGASDIHLRPQADGSRHVLLRIDGALRHLPSIAASDVAAVIRHIELFASIDPFSQRASKEGRCSVDFDGRGVDLRVSVIEGAYGDSMVLRVLDPARFPDSLERLALGVEQTTALQAVLGRPHGLLVVTGPTGSGKTTTLYTLLRELHRRGLHVVTAEDPVEFRIDGINQFETSDFAALLPRLLRHDPDVVMVGELRDTRTVEMALNAALTGHLVLSSVHANDSAATLHRLMGLGAPLHLLSSSLAGILSQRLVRLTCVSCGGAGCGECGHTGYLGRALAAELARPRQSLVRLQGMPTHAEVHEQLDFAGNLTFNDVVVDLASRGRTTWREAASIVTDPAVLPFAMRQPAG